MPNICGFKVTGSRLPQGQDIAIDLLLGACGARYYRNFIPRPLVSLSSFEPGNTSLEAQALMTLLVILRGSLESDR